ncbi:MAG: PKD domain-containing protein [Bacteroidetes bacterium]|jgi:PKD repeat protein|nr:PKD domain-containing protein [Bacteroidota bacterium]MBT6688080.1 PKD domain-containing protein [Bacteroidota bacterium]MBT7142333.1 PKD domain-containing protein [Bacteroidota bacterium]MBT7491147.1 PKD domain-containing protein [Bacteroidota bacterium]
MMKNKYLLMVVAILGVITLNAQIFISGQLIENNGSGIGIPSQTISIQTQGLVLGTAVTNNSGMFYFADSSFSCSMLTDITFSAIDCNGQTMSWTFPCNMNLQVILSMCGGALTSCNADFTYSTNPASGTDVTFISNSTATGNIVSWFWDFGDGTTASGPQQIHTFAAPGQYNTCLTIFTSDSCTSTMCQTVYIDSIINYNCDAYFVYSSAGTNYDLQFMDVSWPVPSIWVWNFDDGTTSNIPNPQHTFPGPGSYNVCLTTYSSAGCTDTYCETLIIDSVLLPNCEAMFTYYVDTASGMSNFYQFFDQSNSLGTITSWYWDFGDGSSSFVQNPTHSFLNGTYVVTLTIMTANGGCSATYQEIIIVGGSVQTFQISGIVSLDSVPLSSGIAMLFGGGQMYTTTISQGYYIFNGLDSNSYIVYAIPDFQLYPNVVPTYFGNSMYWASASEIFLNADFNFADIQMNSYNTTLMGPGSITGMLYFNNTKASSEKYIRKLTESVEDISILLMNTNDELLFHITTDASGHFLFNNLPYGTYKLYVELTGYETFPGIFTINEESFTIEDIEIIINGNSITFTTGIEENNLNTFGEINLYPNPVKDILNVTFTSNLQTDMQMNIFNAIGQSVYSKQIYKKSKTENYQVDVSNWNDGVYFIRLSDEKENTNLKRFIK